jgi:hypothetical protein
MGRVIEYLYRETGEERKRIFLDKEIDTVNAIKIDLFWANTLQTSRQKFFI